MGKQGDDLDGLWVKLFGHPEGHFIQTGGASCTAAVEPADGPMDVDQPQPSTPNEPPQVPSPHVRRRARSCQGLLVGRWMSSNCYRLAPKGRPKCPAPILHRRAQTMR